MDSDTIVQYRLAENQKRFSDFYLAKYNGRRLTWQHGVADAPHARTTKQVRRIASSSFQPPALVLLASSMLSVSPMSHSWSKAAEARACEGSSVRAAARWMRPRLDLGCSEGEERRWRGDGEEKRWKGEEGRGGERGRGGEGEYVDM